MEPFSPENDPNEQRSNLLDDVLDTRMYDKKVKQAQNALFIITAVQLVFGIIRVFTDTSEDWAIDLTVIVVVAGLFLGLALWCKFKPLTALIIALVLYIGLFILDVIADPTMIYRGIIFKVAVVVYLIKGLVAANDARQIKSMGK